MKTRPYLLHALTPLHAGTGQSVGVIDLPLARSRATQAPLVPGSSIKGVLRCASPADAIDADGKSVSPPEDPQDQRQWAQAVFGPDTENASDHAGALAVTDARLFALPVRSFAGTFAWVTSPLILRGAARDLGRHAPAVVELPSGAKPQAAVASKAGHRCVRDATIFLEDLDLAVSERAAVGGWARWLAATLEAQPANRALIEERFVVVDDETMTFLYETAMQIDTRVRIDARSRTVAKGALWTEESLPPESILIGLLVAEHSRRRVRGREGVPVEMNPDAVLDFALGEERILQFGGKATVGRGRCRMLPVKPAEGRGDE